MAEDSNIMKDINLQIKNLNKSQRGQNQIKFHAQIHYNQTSENQRPKKIFKIATYKGQQFNDRILNRNCGEKNIILEEKKKKLSTQNSVPSKNTLYN